jgi:16S rRNA (cytosine967-C5)-methyltransferase
MASNPRSTCHKALIEWEKGKTFSDDILHTLFERNQTAPADRAFVMELFYGVLRQLRRIDAFLAILRNGNVDAPTNALLRLGLYQILHTRIPPHAAVFETVALAGRARGLVNAILRRASRDRDELAQTIDSGPVGVRLSHPDFLTERWIRAFGESATERLCIWNNTPADVYLRPNGLRTTIESLLEADTSLERTELHPKMLKAQRVPREWLKQGLVYVQDPSTLFACDLLDPQPGERVLDACAAPGGKTSYLAEKMHNRGRIVATELFESRTLRLRQNLSRLGATVARVHELDFLMPPEPESPLLEAPFDRILLDVPCSNTGVLRRRVDVRWRITAEDFIRMPIQQFALLRRAIPLLKSSGSLVYSTCSIESEENTAIVQRALTEFPELELVETKQLLPFEHGTDGAFAALFRKKC